MQLIKKKTFGSCQINFIVYNVKLCIIYKFKQKKIVGNALDANTNQFNKKIFTYKKKLSSKLFDNWKKKSVLNVIACYAT